MKSDYLNISDSLYSFCFEEIKNFDKNLGQTFRKTNKSVKPKLYYYEWTLHAILLNKKLEGSPIWWPSGGIGHIVTYGFFWGGGWG